MPDFIFLFFKAVGTESLELLSRLGYSGVFVLGALDRITISLIPTEVLLPIYGLLVGQGKFSFWPTFWIISSGALLGEVVLFFISMKVGRTIVERWGRYFLVSKHDLDHLDRLFVKHGSKIVFWARLLPVGRAIVAIPAGIANLNLGKFTLYSFLGMLPYNLLFLVLGMKIDENISLFQSYFGLLNKVALFILGAAVAWYIYRHIQKRHASH